MGTSHTVPLIFEKSALPCIFAIFLNKTLSDIKFFSKSFKYLNSLGIGSSASLLQTAWQGIALFERCLQYVWQVCVLPSNPNIICWRNFSTFFENLFLWYFSFWCSLDTWGFLLHLFFHILFFVGIFLIFFFAYFLLTAAFFL